MNHTIEQHEGLLRSIARHYNGVDRDDLLQAGRCGLLRAHERYDASRGASFTTYAAHHVRWAMSRHVARVRLDRSRLPVVSLDAPRDNGTTLHDMTATLGITAEARHELKRAIRALPDQERRVIVLRYYTGLTLRETATALGYSHERIRQIEKRALAQLRREI